jgi:hypothetical protein
MVRERGGLQPILRSPGIDHSSFYPGIGTARSGKRMIVHANYENWKGLRVFVDAMEFVRKEGEDVRIISVGRTREPLKASCPIELFIRPMKSSRGCARRATPTCCHLSSRAWVRPHWGQWPVMMWLSQRTVRAPEIPLRTK